jgi:hypothetical protein
MQIRSYGTKNLHAFVTVLVLVRGLFLFARLGLQGWYGVLGT